MAKSKDRQISESLTRCVTAKSKAQAIFDSLSASQRTEISECWPRGIGMDVVHANQFEALKLLTIVGTRGPFARDVQWTRLGAEIGKMVGPPKEDLDGEA